MIIRRARPEDAAALFDVHMRSVHALCASAYSPAHMSAWFSGRSADMYSASLQSGCLWLAEQAGRILGFVEAVPGEVTLLFVAPDAAGKSVGGQLLTVGVERASEASRDAVTVIATMNSVPFYRRHGFRVVEEQFFVRGDPPRRYPVVRMLRDPAASRTEAGMDG